MRQVRTLVLSAFFHNIYLGWLYFTLLLDTRCKNASRILSVEQGQQLQKKLQQLPH